MFGVSTMTHREKISPANVAFFITVRFIGIGNIYYVV
jgi:hypothetical protein